MRRVASISFDKDSLAIVLERFYRELEAEKGGGQTV